MTPSLKGFDHVHIYVADRTAAVKWYADVMAMQPLEEFLTWAEGGGPLTLADPTGNIHLALFERGNFHPSTNIAFGATGEQFLNWKAHLESKGLAIAISDHDMAFSLYFRDPDKNQHEIATYDHEMVRAALG